MILTTILITLSALTTSNCNSFIGNNITAINQMTSVSSDAKKDNSDKRNDSIAITYYSSPQVDTAVQVSQYIRRIFQDKKGNLWFGTNGDGACRYDGKSLTYYTPNEGLSGNAVRGIAEDKDGNLWFGTNGGVSKYDGTKFINFYERDGLSSNDVWSIFIDKTGTIWVCTLEGVCRYDGKTFNNFSIPAATERDFSRGVTSPRIIWNMIEDRAGNIWFATNGGGVYRYDGKNLTNISKQNGLSNNFVNCILEDKNGDIWFATHQGGLSRYDKEIFDRNILFATQNQVEARYEGKPFPNFTTKEGLCGNEVWTMLEDKTGNLWISTRGSVCRFDGKSFTTFTAMDGLTNCCVQSIYEDKAGNLWFGSGAGLFRYDGKTFINITKEGPW